MFRVEVDIEWINGVTARRYTDPNRVCRFISIGVCRLVQFKADLAEVVELWNCGAFDLSVDAALRHEVSEVPDVAVSTDISYLDDTIQQSIDVALLGVVAVKLRMGIGLQLLEILNDLPQQGK